MVSTGFPATGGGQGGGARRGTLANPGRPWGSWM